MKTYKVTAHYTGTHEVLIEAESEIAAMFLVDSGAEVIGVLRDVDGAYEAVDAVEATQDEIDELEVRGEIAE